LFDLVLEAEGDLGDLLRGVRRRRVFAACGQDCNISEGGLSVNMVLTRSYLILELVSPIVAIGIEEVAPSNHGCVEAW
jgi:hypothetical protein